MLFWHSFEISTYKGATRNISIIVLSFANVVNVIFGFLVLPQMSYIYNCIYIYIYIYTYIYIYIYVCTWYLCSAHRGQKRVLEETRRASGTTKGKWGSVASCPIWVLGTELRSFGEQQALLIVGPPLHLPN